MLKNGWFGKGWVGDGQLVRGLFLLKGIGF